MIGLVVGSRCAGDKPATVEDVMPIATGLEREELEAELQVRRPGPFGGLVGGRWSGMHVRFGPGKWFLIRRSGLGFTGKEAVRHGSSRWPLRYQGEVAVVHLIVVLCSESEIEIMHGGYV